MLKGKSFNNKIITNKIFNERISNDITKHTNNIFNIKHTNNIFNIFTKYYTNNNDIKQDIISNNNSKNNSGKYDNSKYDIISGDNDKNDNSSGDNSGNDIKKNKDIENNIKKGFDNDIILSFIYIFIILFFWQNNDELRKKVRILNGKNQEIELINRRLKKELKEIKQNQVKNKNEIIVV